MQIVAQTSSLLRAVAADRLAVGTFGLAWLSIPAVLSLAWLSEEAMTTPAYYAPVALIAAFGCRALTLARGLGHSRQVARMVAVMLVLAACGAMLAAVVGGALFWMAVV